ncbi:hypothetical protein AEQ67_19170 [Pseudomonas sp. RIT-PI-q]|nr:hypothetical protein AEQ67_19170 [Pseudomonas sp. RIT-PI-q]
MPSRYLVQPEDVLFAKEFLVTPVGYHSPGLQRLLNVMRGGRLIGKYVLVVLEPHKKWALGQLSGVRGQAVTLVEGVEYTHWLDAERDVFLRRWHELTGKELSSDIASEFLPKTNTTK